MMDHETISLTALEIPGRIPDSTSWYRTMSEIDEDTSLTNGEKCAHAKNVHKSRNKEMLRRGNRSSFRTDRGKSESQQSVLIKSTKEMAENSTSSSLIKAAVEKPAQIHGNNNGLSTTKASDVTSDHNAPQSGENSKRCARVKIQKPVTLQRRVANSSRSFTKVVRRTATRPSRKINKSSARQLRRMSPQKPEVLGMSAPLTSTYKERAETTEENNNRTSNTEESSGSQTSLVPILLRATSRASSFDTFIQSKSFSKPITRAASTDDLGAFSVSSIHNSYFQNAEKHKAHSPARSSAVRTNGQCYTCKKEILGRRCAQCKNCSSRNNQTEINYGPLGDLRAYAQSIANRVKEILLLSPGSWQSEEVMHNQIPKTEKHEYTMTDSEAKNMSNRCVPRALMHRHKTEINMTQPQETRPKSLLNKSLSYDERVGTVLNEKDGRSPMYLINPANLKTSESLSNVFNVSYSEGSGYILGNNGKHLLVIDGDKNSKKVTPEKQKTKISIRAKTEGDMRANAFQELTPGKKQGKGTRSKTFHRVDASLDEDGGYFQKHQETRNVSNISILKVIHEGTPVDPPYTIGRKRSEDGSVRKAVCVRSATSPNKSFVENNNTYNGDKINALEGALRASKSITKITVRTNKASALRREISLNDKQKVQVSRREENSKTSLTKKRSTSYDSSQPGHLMRNKVQKSVSLYAIADDDEGGKQEKETISAENISIQSENGSESEFWVQSKFPVQTQEYQARKVLPIDPFFQNEMSTDNVAYQVKNSANKELIFETPKETLTAAGEQGEMVQSENRSYCLNNMTYYGSGSENQLSPCRKETARIDDQHDTSIDSYYFYPKKPNQLGNIDAHNVESALNSFEEGGVYHDQMKQYVESGKNSPWYSAPLGSVSHERALVRRDRSLHSKSSTSFHLVTPAKSSHSDEMLKKYHGSFDHVSWRKQSMYTETDVDNGIIYHLAKRQTTRARVPSYYDLIHFSRDIYTMSGDVSTTTSSNSTTSSRSEINECVYTGGFFKVDQFQDNGKISTYSSEDSLSNIYFEPDGVSKRESSELDIYTGSIFNSNQNTKTPSTTYVATEALKDGSTNNSTRSTMAKVQRRVRHRPCVDAINIRSDNSAWGYFSKIPVECCEYKLFNISNNSSNWCGMDEFDGSFNQGSIVTKSKDPLYTDYDPGMRPEFHVNAVEKTVPVFDFLKYESAEEARFQSPSPQIDSGSGVWYSGLLHGQINDLPEKSVKGPDHSPDGCLFSWQHYDDYYTSTVRPRIKRQSRLDHPKKSWNVNNNHFDDIYTGNYGAQNVQARVQEQTNNNRQPATENRYGKTPTPTRSSSNFYEQYDTLYASPGSTRRLSSSTNESPKISRSSTSAFGRESTSYSDSSSYMSDNIWRKYETTQKVPTKSFEEPEKKRRSSPERPSEETESYFHYITNKSPSKSFYITDEDTYSFEPKIVKEKTPETPVIPEIKTVGGIVCRENVANKEDYAEDINRDLEPGPWVPFTLRRDEDARYPLELGHDKSEVPRAVEAFGQGQSLKFSEDSSYAHNRVYDNLGARNKWREMANKKDNESTRSRETSQNRAYQSGDTGKQDHGKARKNSSHNPDKPRGRRSVSNTPKPAAVECSGANKNSGNT